MSAGTFAHTHRKTGIAVVLAVVLLALAVPARAGLVEEAVAKNPGIRAARLAWRAAVEDIRLARALPDPQVKYTFFPDPIETRLGPQDWNLSISQRLPFFAKLTTREKLAAIRAEIARIRYQAKVRDTVTELRRAVARLVYLRRAAALARENRGLVGNAALALSTAATPAISLDIMRAASQTAQADYDLLLIEEKIHSTEAEINAILARPADQPLRGRLEPAAVRPLALPLPELAARILARLEEIRIARLEEKAAGLRRKLARLALVPDASVGLFYAGIGEPDVAAPPPEAGRDALGITLGLSIPLWPGKDLGKTEKSAAGADAAAARREALGHRTAARVSKLYYRLENDLRLVTLYRDTLVPQALSLLATSETEARNRVKSGAATSGSPIPA